MTHLSKATLLAAALLAAGAAGAQTAGTALLPTLRAPAYPLITIDPYTSIWSFGDTLYGQPTRHWTGRPQGLLGYLRVDGQTYAFLGRPEAPVNAPVPTAQLQPTTYRYTNTAPAAGWQQVGFNDKSWQTGHGLLATEEVGRGPQSPWQGPEVWQRRTVELAATPEGPLQLLMLHDDDVDVYLNGVPAFDCAPCFNADYGEFPIAPRAAATLHKGTNVIAAHCRNTGGPGLLDIGIIGPPPPDPARRPARQLSVSLTATQTAYQFACGPVQLDVTFTAPLLLDQLEVMSRPADYVTFKAQGTDGRPHDVQLYFGASPQLAVNTPAQAVSWQRGTAGPLTTLRVGTTQQNVLGTKGDNVRLDWGYAYLAAGDGAATSLAPAAASRAAFRQTGALPPADAPAAPRAANDNPVELAVVWNMGQVGRQPISHHLLVGYDDEYSVNFFGEKLRPWWRRSGATAAQMLAAAEQDYPRLLEACSQFDQQLRREAQAAGGPEYARLCELAYRQAVAAHKLVAGPNGQPLFFSKENFSNGSIGTVDITYPSAPLFLRYNPTLLKGMMTPIFQYSESGKWTKPFAAHDVGTYPLALGQTYGEDMPVEESGNMLILTAAIAAAEGNADYARQHWPTLTTWAELPERKRARPGKPAFHRRLLRPPGPQRQPLGEGHSGPGLLRPPGQLAGRQSHRRRLLPAGAGHGREVDPDGPGRRPLPPHLRQAGHLEPEV